jgi:hypothetical protein
METVHERRHEQRKPDVEESRLSSTRVFGKTGYALLYTQCCWREYRNAQITKAAEWLPSLAISTEF